MQPSVVLEGITKRFPGVVANDDVNVTVAAGEIHAIVGENGAGKSTLMKILYGMQAPDEGRMFVDGDEVRFTSPKDAIERGIGMVHQHFMLADNLTVLENVILGSEPVVGGFLDFDGGRERILEIGRRYGLEVDPDELVEDLEVGERQRVEIIKVLFRGARILILDEPTAVLVPQEVQELFENLRSLRAEGNTIILIDHKLDEVLAIADTITVMRAGRTVATLPATGVTTKQLAELMVGSELPSPETTESTVTDIAEFEVEDLVVRDELTNRVVIDDMSFVVHRGEVLGVAGIEGNGQAELIDTLLGIRQPASGRVRLGGQDITDWDVRRRRKAGIGYVPEDRHRRGLLLTAPLWENVMLGHQTSTPFTRGFWINREGARKRAQAVVEEFDVRTPNVDVAAHALSGGNQQKLIFGREMAAGPRFLIAAHPTRGIDVGAQAAVWDQLRAARAKGLAVLLVSADLDELIGLSDTIVVIFRGRLVARLDPSEVTPEALGSYMTGAAVQGV
ncbi:MAG TPA: ABC transporter ATP-binding protein [Acidimicrobiales bacterium]